MLHQIIQEQIDMVAPHQLCAQRIYCTVNLASNGNTIQALRIFTTEQTERFIPFHLYSCSDIFTVLCMEEYVSAENARNSVNCKASP